MKANYMVGIQVQAGEYEKCTHVIITNAPSIKKASHMALASECHGNAEWNMTHEVVYDAHGEFAYSVKSITELTDKELKVVGKYIAIMHYDPKLIKSMVK